MGLPNHPSIKRIGKKFPTTIDRNEIRTQIAQVLDYVKQRNGTETWSQQRDGVAHIRNERTNERATPSCKRVKLQCQQRTSGEPRARDDERERQECEGLYSAIPTIPLRAAVK